MYLHTYDNTSTDSLLFIVDYAVLGDATGCVLLSPTDCRLGVVSLGHAFQEPQVVEAGDQLIGPSVRQPVAPAIRNECELAVDALAYRGAACL